LDLPKDKPPSKRVFDVALPVPVTDTSPELRGKILGGLDVALTVKLTSVNVESGPAVSVLVPKVKSLGIGTKEPTVPV
jgi:hypothetical protein